MATGVVGGVAFLAFCIVAAVASIQLLRGRPEATFVAALQLQYFAGCFFSGSLWGSGTFWCLTVAVIGIAYGPRPE